jgi:PQQ-like domain
MTVFGSRSDGDREMLTCLARPMRQAVVLTLFCSLQMPAVVEASPSVPQQGQTKGSDFSTTPASVRGWADRVTAKDPKVRASADADLVQGVPRSLPLLRRFLDSQDEALHAVIPRPRALSRGSITASPVFADGRVFVAMGQSPGHGNGPSSIHAISPNGQGDVTTSRLLWSSREVGRVVGTPIVKDGLLYVGDLGGTIHCLDAASGAHVWKHETLDPIWGSLLLAGDRLYVGNVAGSMTVLRAGRQKEVLATIEMDAPLYSRPAVIGDAIYLATGNRLYLIAATP